MAKDSCYDQYNDICKDEFAELKTMVKSVDDAIRGNGKEGLVTRIVKNEQRHKLLFWVLTVEAGMILTIIGKLIYNHFTVH